MTKNLKWAMQRIAFGILLVLGVATSNAETFSATPQQSTLAAVNFTSGIVFKCSPEGLARTLPMVDRYLSELGVDQALVKKNMSSQTGVMSYVLAYPSSSGDTLGLIDDPRYGLTEELIALPTKSGKSRTILTVSKKEIVYAMLQHGRATVFDGPACDVQALMDHIGVRQNTVAWGEVLSWKWPNGGPARWNKKYWNKGDLVKGRKFHEALNDIFIQQEKYAIGCYTAAKLVMIQGALDYYRRIKKDIPTAQLVEAKLFSDNEPLRFIEPGIMWSFEPDSSEADRARPGKLLAIEHGVAAKNFIPGDWSYFLNTDPVTYEKRGYEGSNAIYLGRGRFDDFYDDHHHFYTYKEKLDEVYQWRNKVFSRSRDVAKVRPLAPLEIERLGNTPAHGGLVLDLRVSPYLFGYEASKSVSGVVNSVAAVVR